MVNRIEQVTDSLSVCYVQSRAVSAGMSGLTSPPVGGLHIDYRAHTNTADDQVISYCRGVPISQI